MTNDSSTATARTPNRAAVSGPRLAQRLQQVINGILGPRALMFGVLAIVAFFSVAGWIRPPLSPDIRGWHLPMFASLVDPASAEALLYGPRRFAPLSVGAIMLALTAAAFVLTAIHPRWFAACASILLAAAAAANAAAAINHPALYELLDDQLSQYAHIATFLSSSVNDAVTEASSARVIATPLVDFHEMGLGRGAVYLWYGRWLIPLTAAAVLFGTRGGIRRRLAALGKASAGAVCAAVLICLPGLRGEYRFQAALRHEDFGEYAAAQQALSHPRLAQLERTWLLTGRIEQRLGASTLARRVFHAAQLERDRQFARALDELRAVSLDPKGPSGLIQRRMARLLAHEGRARFESDQTVAAIDLWRKAGELSPAHLDCTVYIAVVQARLDDRRPELVESAVRTVLQRSADRLIRADLLATLADARFEARDFAAARDGYLASMRAFSLPKQINYRAQRGLVGM